MAVTLGYITRSGLPCQRKEEEEKRKIKNSKNASNKPGFPEKRSTYAIGARDRDIRAAVAVEGFGAGVGGQLAGFVHGDCSHDAVGGDAGGAGGGGVGAWFEGVALGEGEVVSVVDLSFFFFSFSGE